MGEVICGDLVPNRSLNCEYVKLDVLDANDISKKLDNYNTIINCIGQITRPFNLCFKLNSIGMNNLVKALSSKSRRFIHNSTVAVYGSAENCNEDSPLNPETNYATVKALAEQILLENYEHKQLLILRLSNLYGRYQTKGVFAYLLRSYYSDRKLNFNNDGSLTRSFMHVEDCADLIIEIVKNPTLTGIYNVKGPESYSVKELIQKFEDRFNMKFEKNFDQIPPWENIQVLDDSKLQSLVNVNSRWQLFDFIEQEIRNYTYDQ